ncbi:hypothetical protein V2J09_016234 [Rumex salicifolius]
MGNCQTADAAATVLIQHPGGPPYKMERIYRPISAHDVMGLNPGHYVARLTMSSSLRLQLLRPADSLYAGQVYRLIRFEDVVKEFASSSSNKSVKLGKLLLVGPSDPNPNPDPNTNPSGLSRSGVVRLGNWKPALPSIAEIGN